MPDTSSQHPQYAYQRCTGLIETRRLSAGRPPMSVKKQIAKGAIWMLAFKLTERLLGLFSTIILARILLPSDFGIVAMAASLVAVLELLTSFSFDVALIQRHELDRRHL